MEKPHMFLYSEKSVNFTIYDVKWVPCSAKFCALGMKPKGTGIIQIYELSQENHQLILVKEIEKKNSFKCGTFGASSLRNRHMAIGDMTGRILVLDLEHSDIPVYNVKAHEGIIHSIDGMGGSQIDSGPPEIVTGGRDGSVKVWDIRQGNMPVVDISPKGKEGSIGGDSVRECWAVGFGNSYNNDDRIVAAGFDNGDLKLFDLRNLCVRWETTLKNGICSIEFDRKDIPMNKLLVTTLEGGLIIYDMRTQHPENGFTCLNEKDAGRSVGSKGVISGPKSTLWCGRHLPQNRDIFVTCGGTGSVRLWNYEYPEKKTKKATDGHDMGVTGTVNLLHAATLSTQPINCFDWNSDHLGLGICGSFDQNVRVVLSTGLNLV